MTAAASSLRAVRRAGEFRSTGVKNYRVPSTGRYLEGSGSGEARAGETTPAGADIEVKV